MSVGLIRLIGADGREALSDVPGTLAATGG
jgi:hypothetical protein